MPTRATATSPAIQGLREALVTSTRDGELRVKPVGAKPRRARLAAHGYRPRVGDRVLVAPGENDDTLYVLAPLFEGEHARVEQENATPDGKAAAPSVRTPSGASASVEGETLVVRDARGRIAVQFDASSGKAVISAPDGDLELAAPSGRVRITAATDLSFEAGRDLTHSARRGIALRTGEGPLASRIALDAHEGASITAPATRLDSAKLEARVTEGSLVAERVHTVVAEVAHAVGRWELRARQLVERADSATRDVEGLLLTRAGRSRTLVRGALDLLAQRARLVSKEDTVIDGKRVLLG